MAKLNLTNEIKIARNNFKKVLKEKIAANSCAFVEETTARCFFNNASEIEAYIENRCICIYKNYYGKDTFICIDGASKEGLHYIEVFKFNNKEKDREEWAASYCGSIPFDWDDSIVDGIIFAIMTNNIKVKDVATGVLVFYKDNVAIENEATGDGIIASVNISEADIAKAMAKINNESFFFVFNIVDEYDIVEHNEEGEEFIVTESDEKVRCIIAKSYSEAYAIAEKETGTGYVDLLFTCPVNYAMAKVKDNYKDKAGYLSATNIAIALEHLFTPGNCYQTYFDYEVANALGLTQEEE